ncbi:MAG: hypothetical protein QNJ97_08825 [Myxococcota bacterium]|nr:hypothetical protein [Myxococcota bacterium]
MNPLSDNHGVTEAGSELLAIFAGLKRRGQILTLISGLGWVLAGVALLLFGFIVALGWFGGTGLRALSWVVIILGTVALSTLGLLLPLLNLSQSEAVARKIGQLFPDLASDVLTANQLALAPHQAGFSQDLVLRHLRMVHQAITEIPIGGVIFPMRSLTWPGLALVAATAVGIVTQTFFAGATTAGLASLWREPIPPDPKIDRVSAMAPVVGDLTLTLRYPEYFDREERRLNAISGGLVAPLGTTVVIEGTSLVPRSDRGVIRLPDGSQRPLSVGVDGTVHGRFVVGGPGNFSLALGTRSLLMEGPTRNIEVEADRPPVIRVLRPTKRVEVAEDGEVVIELEAEDDHGLRYLDLVLRTESGLELRKTIIHLADQVRRLKTQYRWTPESVKIEDKADIQLEVEAFDNDSILGPKSGQSEAIDICVLTPLSRHKNAINDQNGALDMLVALLARRLETPLTNARRGKAAEERFTMLQRETEDALGKMAHLIQVLNRDSLSPKQVTDTFVSVRQDLSNQLFHEARLYGGGGSGDFRKRKGVDRVTIRLLESAIVRVDDLIIEQQLSRVVHAGGTLEHQRDEIETLLKKYNRTRAEPLRRALIESIARMEEALQRLERDVEAFRGKVGDTFLNPSSLLNFDPMGSLSKLKSLLADGDLLAATRLIQTLESDLGRLLAGLEGALLSFRTERFGEGERYIGELLDKLLSIEAGQLQLRRETTAMQRRYQERLVAAMRGRIDPLVKRHLQKTRKMHRSVKKIKTQKSEAGRLRLAQLRITVREMRLALSQGDLDEALQIAGEIRELTTDWQVETGSKRPSEIRDVRRTAKQIVEEITQAFPRPSQLLSDRDLRLARSYASRQRHLLGKTRKLRTWTGIQKSATRFLSNRASGALRAVIDHMAAAITSLDKKQVRQALLDQSEALEELARLREDLKRGNEVAPLESRPIVLRGKVELPDPDDYEVPPEFREDILEAMHGDLPYRYEAAIRSYYENLVR